MGRDGGRERDVKARQEMDRMPQVHPAATRQLRLPQQPHRKSAPAPEAEETEVPR